MFWSLGPGVSPCGCDPSGGAALVPRQRGRVLDTGALRVLIYRHGESRCQQLYGILQWFMKLAQLIFEKKLSFSYPLPKVSDIRNDEDIRHVAYIRYVGNNRYVGNIRNNINIRNCIRYVSSNFH